MQVHCFSLSLRPWFAALRFLSSSVRLLSLQSFPLFVRFPWPTNKSSGRRTVEQFMAPVWSSFSWPQSAVAVLWCISILCEQAVEGNAKKRGWKEDKEWKRKMKRPNKSQLGKAKGRTPPCAITKLPLLIPFTISTARRHRMTIQSADFYPPVQLIQLWKSFQFSLKHTYTSCTSSSCSKPSPLFLWFQSPNQIFPSWAPVQFKT